MKIEMRALLLRHKMSAALTSMLMGLVLLLFYFFPIHALYTIDAKTVTHEEGHAYMVISRDYFPLGARISRIIGPTPDSSMFPEASDSSLLEDGREFGEAHSPHDDIRKKGMGRYSHWGNAIIFSTSDNSSPIVNGRKYAIRCPILPTGWLPLLVFILEGLGLYLLFPTSEMFQKVGKWIWWGSIITLCIYLNIVFFGLLSAPFLSPDSDGYLDWSLFRTMGYPALIYFYNLLFKSLAYLHFIQLNLVLLGLFGLSYAIIRISGSFAVGWFFIAVILSAGNMLLPAADVMTEAFFGGFVMMHLAFMYLFLMESRNLFGLFSGIALAAAILIKSVAVVFLGPLFLFLIFSPVARRRMLVLLLPAFIAWFAPSAYNYSRNGVFESSIMGGIALGGHVAWAIHPYPGSAFPVEAKLIETRLEPILAKRPSEFKGIKEYVIYTTNEYNTLLWNNILPELSRYYHSVLPASACQGGCLWSECTDQCVLQIDKTLMQLSKEAIANNPGQYAKHVLAHFAGLWGIAYHGNADFLNGINGRAEKLPEVYNFSFRKNLLASLPPFKTKSELDFMASSIKGSSEKKAVDLLLMSKIFNYVTRLIDLSAPLILLISLIASALVFRLRTISSAAKAFCYTGLFVNSYFLGTALAADSVYRLAFVMQGAVAALVCLGVVLVIKVRGDLIGACKSLIRRNLNDAKI